MNVTCKPPELSRVGVVHHPIFHPPSLHTIASFTVQTTLYTIFQAWSYQCPIKLEWSQYSYQNQLIKVKILSAPPGAPPIVCCSGILAFNGSHIKAPTSFEYKHYPIPRHLTNTHIYSHYFPSALFLPIHSLFIHITLKSFYISTSVVSSICLEIWHLVPSINRL